MDSGLLQGPALLEANYLDGVPELKRKLACQGRPARALVPFTRNAVRLAVEQARAAGWEWELAASISLLSSWRLVVPNAGFERRPGPPRGKGGENTATRCILLLWRRGSEEQWATMKTTT